jgi:hypothetical protein
MDEEEEDRTQIEMLYSKRMADLTVGDHYKVTLVDNVIQAVIPMVAFAITAGGRKLWKKLKKDRNATVHLIKTPKEIILDEED